MVRKGVRVFHRQHKFKQRLGTLEKPKGLGLAPSSSYNSSLILFSIQPVQSFSCSPAVAFISVCLGKFEGSRRCTVREAKETGWFASSAGLVPDDIDPDLRERGTGTYSS